MNPPDPFRKANPGEVLLGWFHGQPPQHAAQVAHLYLMCTAENLDPFFMDPEEAMAKFTAMIRKKDMPVRTACRLMSVAAVLDFVIQCIAKGEHHRLMMPGMTNVVDLRGVIWDKTIASWISFRKTGFSPSHLATWFVSIAGKTE